MQLINTENMKRQESYQEDDFNGFLQDLINSNRLDSKEEGISKLVLDKGYESLSEKQKYVFDKMIDTNTISECKRCACDIPWCEMLEALDNGGYCNYCQHMMEKIEKE